MKGVINYVILVVTCHFIRDIQHDDDIESQSNQYYTGKIIHSISKIVKTDKSSIVNKISGEFIKVSKREYIKLQEWSVLSSYQPVSVV